MTRHWDDSRVCYEYTLSLRHTHRIRDAHTPMYVSTLNASLDSRREDSGDVTRAGARAPSAFPRRVRPMVRVTRATTRGRARRDG
jgi:hypothetical protein